MPYHQRFFAPDFFDRDFFVDFDPDDFVAFLPDDLETRFAALPAAFEVLALLLPDFDAAFVVPLEDFEPCFRSFSS